MASALLWDAPWGDVHVAEEGEEQQVGGFDSAWSLAFHDVADSAIGEISDDCMSCASLGSRPSEGDLAEGAPVDGCSFGERTVEATLALIESTPDSSERMDLFETASRVIEDARLDAKSMQVASHFLCDMDHVSNSTVGAAAIGVDRKAFRNVRLASSSAAHHMEKRCWARLEATLADQAEANRVQLLF